MKIEKVNENQIRCTLTREDLDSRQLKLSEIAYGSEKAKSLFKDVMQQASYEYGFEAEDIPLMIEAIPMSSGCIVFIITKVEDPEELDTRFSKFAPSIHEGEEMYEEEIYESYEDTVESLPQSAEEVFDLFRKIAGKKLGENNTGAFKEKKAPALPAPKASDKSGDAAPMLRLCSFAELDSLTDIARLLNGYYNGESALYKHPGNGKYFLLLDKGNCSQKDFIKVSNILMEYGTVEKATPASLAYMEEHFDVLLADNAIEALSQIG